MSDGPDPRVPPGQIHCDGFARSQAIRRVLASGKPPVAREWDSRMPIPAGVTLDRRRFLLAAAGGMALVYGAGRAGLTNNMLGDGIAQAATLQKADSPILVSLFMQGGVDSLSAARAGGRSAVREAASDAGRRARVGGELP